MTPLEFRLLSLSKQAHSVAVRLAKVIPVFDGLPEWPSASVSPVWVLTPDETLKMILPDPFLRAVALRQRHDPDELSPWTFCPAGDESNNVWLVRTKAFDVGLN